MRAARSRRWSVRERAPRSRSSTRRCAVRASPPLHAPIYAGDAVRGTTNPLFAVRALREFIELCLQYGPIAPRTH